MKRWVYEIEFLDSQTKEQACEREVDLLKRRGDAGWELVHVIAWSYWNRRYYFKQEALLPLR